ncbi:2'-5' RNA ligase [Mangrovactinospora gilvigrisea]|uniref:2'-5' RNA ligase n=1 Tax=Mangrovactinospora gilvigrisea TaxID=1428644 RepID=A0A1J7BDL9_9ACTN|nr:2'-5' RNA ligase family protein [Mangrovactinospora gilvigrisea]OIV36677.1 2'-5' RNA ligase [Mangrovactinospora gilvigrisea]
MSIAVPEPYGSQLQAVRDGYGDPLARAIPTHITLLGPTEVPAERLPELEPHLAGVAAAFAPFPMRLCGTSGFRPVSPVVFVEVVKGAGTTDALQERVRTGLLAGELRFPFHAHVTIGHDLPDEVLERAEREQAGFAADFEVTEFCLYLHGADGVWRPQWKFPLGAAR